MNRRSFLQLFAAGLPAAVVAEKIGLLEKARKYFFAPKGGWISLPAVPPDVLAFQRALERRMEFLTGAPLQPELLIVHPAQLKALLQLGYYDVSQLNAKMYRAHGLIEPPPAQCTYAGVRVVPDPLVPKDEWRELYRSAGWGDLNLSLHGYASS